MAGILRGEIYLADLSPSVGREQAGHRPVLVISHNIFNERSGTVIALAITSQPPRAGFPLTLQLKTRSLPKTVLGQDKSDTNTIYVTIGGWCRS